MRVVVPVRQSGPGHYEAKFPTKESGTYAVNVVDIAPDTVGMPADLPRPYDAIEEFWFDALADFTDPKRLWDNELCDFFRSSRGQSDSTARQALWK